MKKTIIVFLFFCFSTFQTEVLAQESGKMKVIDVAELQELMSYDGQKLKVINFWATWCKPCIKELPYFVNAQQQFPNVEFVYMSIDFSENAEKAEKFANKKGLNPSGLYLIDDVDYNSWIDLVSPEWSGAIPATLLMRDGEKYFYEQEFHDGELEEIIKQKLN